MNTAIITCVLAASTFASGASDRVPHGRPDVSVDLATAQGAELVQGVWRVHPAELVRVPFRAAGPDHKASGAPSETWDVEPRAGARDFDDKAWRTLAPDRLDERIGAGKLSFAWYRMRVTVPERIGALDPRGATVVLETVVDDYAEVWVDGSLSFTLGQRGGTVVAGWNAPNRVVLTSDARPGQEIQLAIFGVNGPLSEPPSNFIWMRSARLDFHGQARAIPPRPVALEVERLSPRLDAAVPPGSWMEQLVEGLAFGEGPVWTPEGALLFSDPNRNRIYRFTPPATSDPSAAGDLTVFRERSGYTGEDEADYGQPGSNGLAFDALGRLTACEHGDHRVTRTEPDGSVIVLADRYQGRRLNSPNDLVYRSDGTLYFTDPPFGLPQFHEDPRRELDLTGVYRWYDGALSLELAELTGPNGLVFSPDERWLYVTNWDERRKVVLRLPVDPSTGALGEGRVFFDMGAAPEPEALDGIEVDANGNLFVCGPGGVWVIAPDGEHLGTLRCPELPANLAWGDAPETLYATARTGLYRLHLTAVPRTAEASSARRCGEVAR